MTNQQKKKKRGWEFSVKDPIARKARWGNTNKASHLYTQVSEVVGTIQNQNTLKLELKPAFLYHNIL